MGRSAIVLTAIVLGLSACGGGGQNALNTAGNTTSAANGPSAPSTPGTPNATSTPNIACLSVESPRLVYPASGATGIPTNLNLAVTYPENPGRAFGLPVLISTTSASVTGGSWTAAANFQWISAVANLASATTYSVEVTNTVCGQHFKIGSFTTK